MHPHLLAQRRQLGNLAIEIGANEASKVFNVSTQLANYWKKKREEDTHTGNWGGTATFKYDKEEVDAALWATVKSAPCSNLREIKSALAERGFHYSESWISKKLKSWLLENSIEF